MESIHGRLEKEQVTFMIEFIGAAAGILAVTGVLLNNRRLRICFIFWMISNFLSALIHIGAGIWSLAARDLIFLVLTVEGWFLWKGKIRDIEEIEKENEKLKR